MDKLKKRFVAARQNLPKDWARQVSKTLADKGYTVTPGKVSDVRRGKNKDPQLILEINEIVKEMKRTNKQQRKLRPII